MIVAGFAERRETTKNTKNSSVIESAMTGKWFWTAVAVGMLLVASSGQPDLTVMDLSPRKMIR